MMSGFGIGAANTLTIGMERHNLIATFVVTAWLADGRPLRE